MNFDPGYAWCSEGSFTAIERSPEKYSPPWICFFKLLMVLGSASRHGARHVPSVESTRKKSMTSLEWENQVSELLRSMYGPADADRTVPSEWDPLQIMQFLGFSPPLGLAVWVAVCSADAFDLGGSCVHV